MNAPNGIERRRNQHECEHTADFSELRRDVADLSVEISCQKDTLSKMYTTLALMELRMTTMTDYLSDDRKKYEKHLEEGKSWRIGVILALLGSVGTFAYALVNYGVLTEKVIHAEKVIDARTFGALEVESEKKA